MGAVGVYTSRCKIPVSILMVVDLLAPFGPMKPSDSPVSIWNIFYRFTTSIDVMLL